MVKKDEIGVERFFSSLGLLPSYGIYPNKLKLAKIIPAFKGDDATGAGDYRPISLLYTYNTISEKLMFTRISKFIDEYDFLFDSQCGFRTKHDIQHAILDIINTIQCNMDQGKYSFGIFIDLKKRFLRWIIVFFYLSPTITVLGMSCMTGLNHT